MMGCGSLDRLNSSQLPFAFPYHPEGKKERKSKKKIKKQILKKSDGSTF